MGSVRSAASRLRGLSGNAEVREWIGWAADELSNNAERIADLEAEQQLSRESLGVMSRKVDGLEAELDTANGRIVRLIDERDALIRELDRACRYLEDAGDTVIAAGIRRRRGLVPPLTAPAEVADGH